MPRRPRKDTPDNELLHGQWRARLRRYRFTRNIKQAALAADLGVTQAMVSRWESGVVDPSPGMQQRIMDLLRTDTVGAPLIDWRTHAGEQPGLAAVINRSGLIETASQGLARLLGRGRSEIEGEHVQDVFTGDLPRLFGLLLSAGFFDEAVESVESADRYCFVDRNGQVAGCCVQGLHWPHRGEDGEIRWMLSGARIDEADFEELRRAMPGQFDLVTAR
ncbi:helix-turn-helix transcriptional regulator [Maricaulis sp.]|uniref:helix-turn-helix domain-containing protein n=1 Tax=Maricaulis sp. TaxID=1486257 RepID=UPI002611201E|nr:helix-turn-helix transcriptional regulator [Maricaulis sp.]